MNTITKDFVSDRELASRLEVFEENLRLEEQNKLLEDKLKAQQIGHVEELSRIKHQAGDPIQTAIDILQSHQHHQEQLAQTERQRDLFDRENEELRTHVAELTASGEKLHDQVVHYKDQCEKQLAKHNSEVQKALGAIDFRDRQLAQLNAELKELRSLNPQRLQKQVKEQKKKISDLQDANQQLRIKGSENQKIRKEHEERGRIIDKLYADNRRLDAALHEACSQMNENSKVQPIETHGDWSIYAHDDGTQALILHHGPTDSSAVYWAGEGFKKRPALPVKIKARAEAMIANYVETKGSMIDYAGGEQVEVA